jgi:hypothetical protein
MVVPNQLIVVLSHLLTYQEGGLIHDIECLLLGLHKIGRDVEDILLKEDDGPAGGVATHQQGGKHVVHLVFVLIHLQWHLLPLLNVTPQQFQTHIVLFGRLVKVLADGEGQMEVQGPKERQVLVMRDCPEELLLDKVNGLDVGAIPDVSHQCV